MDITSLTCRILTPLLARPLESRTIEGHGTFSYQPAILAAIMHTMTRREIVALVCAIYEDQRLQPGRPDTPAHWDGYPTADLAAIVADANPVEDSEGRVIGGGAWFASQRV